MTYLLIGCGNLGEIILNGFYVKKKKLSVFEKKKKNRNNILRKYKKVKVFDNLHNINWAEINHIMICVKPIDSEKSLNEIKEYCLKKHIIISFVAGLNTEFISKKLGNKCQVVRIMPNIFISTNTSATAIYINNNNRSLKSQIFNEFNHFGILVKIEDEKKMDFFTAMFGGGPAYIFFILDILMKIIKKNGFTDKDSLVLLNSLLEGAIKKLQKGNIDFKSEISEVASRGGTTEEALNVFSQKDRLLNLFNKAISAATNKSIKISKNLNKSIKYR